MILRFFKEHYLSLFWLSVIALGIIYMNQKPVVCKESVVTSVGMCTDDVNNAWDGYRPGTCRVKTNAGYTTLPKPVMVGETVRDCRWED